MMLVYCVDSHMHPSQLTKELECKNNVKSILVESDVSLQNTGEAIATFYLGTIKFQSRALVISVYGFTKPINGFTKPIKLMKQDVAQLRGKSHGISVTLHFYKIGFSWYSGIGGG
ncbi:hypothetical protein ACHAXN_006818 [Cyclotella atomus]